MSKFSFPCGLVSRFSQCKILTVIAAVLVCAVWMVGYVIGEGQTVTLPEDWERRTEAYTFYQTGSYYNPQTDCQTDGVKVCIFQTDENNRKLVKSFMDSPLPKPVQADFTAAQDTGNMFISGKFDGNTHYDTVIKKMDGSDWQFGLLPGLPYILPTKEWNDYIVSKLLVGIDEGASAVTIQELGVFGDTGYEEAFRREWKEYYGTEWSATLWTDPNLYFMGQDLRNYMAKRQVEQVFTAVKKYKSSVKTIFSNHTSPSYFGFLNSVGNHDIMALDCVDGVEGQSWSNTIMLPFRYDGKIAERPFATAFSEYSFWSVLGRQFPKKEVYTICDPKGDGFDSANANISLEKCDELYRHQIVSQLAFPDIYRYNTVVWPDRSMSRGGCENLTPVSTDDFNTIICNIVSVQANMYKYREPVISENQPVKVGVMSLDSMCYPAGGPTNTVSYDCFFSSFAGLFYNGVMVEAIPAGREKSHADVLKDYDLIIVSYDLMKPQNTLVNEKLAEYVEQGGVVLFMSGQSSYEDLVSTWWNQAGLSCPLDDLLARVDLQTSKRKTGLRSALLSPSDARLAKTLGELPMSGNLIGYASVGNATPLYYGDDGNIIAFGKVYGKGHFYYFGIDPNFFGDANKGDVLFGIVKAMMAEAKSATIVPKGSISYRRGPVYGFAAVKDESPIEQGQYIDLFDPRLGIVTALSVPEGRSELLYDVAGKIAAGKPAVLFAQGNNPAVYESSERLRVVTAGPTDTFGCIRVYLPGGQDSVIVTAVDGKGKNVLTAAEYDAKSKTMLINFHNDLLKVVVDVFLGSTPAPAKSRDVQDYFF